MSITHAKVSAKADGGDASKVRPSDWNADHVGGMVWTGAWSGATAYVVGDVVSVGDRAYVCTAAHTNHTPPNGTYWDALSAIALATATLTCDTINLPSNAGYSLTKGLLFAGGSKLVEQTAASGAVDRMQYCPNGDWFDVLTEDATAYIISCRGGGASTNPDSFLAFADTIDWGTAGAYTISMDFNAYSVAGNLTYRGGGSGIAGFNFNKAVTVGDGTNYSQQSATGDVVFAGSAGFYPRKLSQAAAPAAGTGATQLDTGEMCIWHDSGTGLTWLCYNDGGTIRTTAMP